MGGENGRELTAAHAANFSAAHLSHPPSQCRAPSQGEGEVRPQPDAPSANPTATWRQDFPLSAASERLCARCHRHRCCPCRRHRHCRASAVGIGARGSGGGGASADRAALVRAGPRGCCGDAPTTAAAAATTEWSSSAMGPMGWSVARPALPPAARARGGYGCIVEPPWRVLAPLRGDKQASPAPSVQTSGALSTVRGGGG